MGDRILDLEFSSLGRSGKPWLGFYVAVILLALVGGSAWGCATYFRVTEPAACELRGTMMARAGQAVNVYQCPNGAVLMQPSVAPARLPMPRVERADEL